MPSSYTTSLRLTLPATGELTGTWGTTVNTGITELLDSAVAGTTTISSWGGAGVPYTLSNTDGAADEARRMFIVATGAPGEAKNVICPAVSKLYFFRNDTTGGFALTLKTSGGSGITVPAGQARVLYCNGTNVVEAFNAISSLTLGTALGAGSGGTGQSTYTTGDLIYATGATTLAKLGIGTNGQILTSTGTAPQWSTLSGVAVTTFSAGTTGFTPSTATSGAVTLAGTLSTANGGTGLSSFTANRVLYTSSTSAIGQSSNLTFDGTQLATNNFRLNGILLDGAGNATFSPISAGSLAIVSNGTYTNGNILYNALAASGIHAWQINNAEQMRLTSTGLGIGTSSPTAKLTVQGDQNITDGTSTIRLINSGGQALFGTSTNHPLVFRINNTQQMILDTSGNLGLGVTPSAWSGLGSALQVNRLSLITGGSSAVDSYLTSNGFWNGTSWTYIGTAAATQYVQNAAGDHRWRIAASGTAGTAISFTQAMTLDPSGNLLAGVTTQIYPSANRRTVEVNGTSQALFGLGVGGTAAGYLLHDGADMSLYQTRAGALLFGTNNVERMRLDSSGNLGIGTTSPGTKLDVTGIDGQGIQFRTASRTVGIGQISSEAAVYWGSGTALTFSSAAVERARIDSSGNLLVGTTTNTNSSRLTVNGTISETVSSVQYLVASQFDVGTAPNKIPLNQYLGNLAYQNASAIAGQVGFSAGTAALPSIASATDLTTGRWFPAAGVMAWSTSGAERMRLTANGNLLVGTTTDANYRAMFTAAGSANGNAFRPITRISDFTSGVTISGTSAPLTITLDMLSAAVGPTALSIHSVAPAVGHSQALEFVTSTNGAATGTVRVGERLGLILFGGANGTSFSLGATISAFADAVPSAGNPISSDLRFGTNNNERARITSAGNQIDFQPAESAQNTSVTLTVANLQTRIITSNAAVTLTLPTGTDLDTYATSMATNTAFECTFIATTANAITIAANGNTTVGSLTVGGNTSGTFRFRKTAANTFTVYRVA